MANIQKYPIFCNECIGQQFQSKEAAIKHVRETHEIFTPHLVQDYINVDEFCIGFVVNKILGANKFKWIKIPNHSPFCHGCDSVFSSWNDAVAHAISSHKVGNDYALCQMIGKDILTLIPEIRKRLYTCIYCPPPKVFQFNNSLKHHLMAYHEMSENDASSLANVQRK